MKARKFVGLDVEKATGISRIRECLFVVLAIVLLVLSFVEGALAEELLPSPAPILPLTDTLEPSVEIDRGQDVFVNTCSACHIGGTNVIVPQKKLTQEALEKYAMDSVDAIKQQVTQGKNAMPAFAKRLTPEQIDAVSSYVLEQADAGW
jgi:cytochrome c6